MNQILEFLLQNSPLLKSGLITTLLLWLGSTCISICIGIPLGILSTQNLRIPILSPAIKTYVVILRAIPVYVQLLLVYFVLPDIIGINLSAPIAAIMALGLCSSAFVIEIVRSSINALPQNQWDAGFLLGYTKSQSLWYTILPQSLPTMIPPLTNEFEAIFKSTAIVSTIGVLELTRIGNNIVARTMKPIPIYCCIAVLYLCLSLILMLCMRSLEKYFTKDRA